MLLAACSFVNAKPSIHSSMNTLLYRAGTGAEHRGPTARELHAEQLLPIFQAKPDIWPEMVQSYEAFEHAAGMVQSRTFHMQQTNWLTGSSLEGMY